MKETEFYIHKCPKCGHDMIYKTKSGFDKAEENKTLCRSCRDLEKGLAANYTRNCPICNKLITYKRRSDWLRGVKSNSKCLHCSDNSGKFKSGIKMITSTSTPKYSLDNLLNQTKESYYWLGFILADGSFYKNRFEFTLKASDLNQIKKLCEFLDIDSNIIIFKPKTNSYKLTFNNKNSIENIMNVFGIHYVKTYNPCNFTNFKKLTNSDLTALLIGIIDGDGCIDKSGKYITITAHKNWKKFYTDLIDTLNLNFHINERKNGTLSISAGNKLVREYFYNYLQNNNLPILERKWNRLKI